jgi:hypothetical protein
MSSWVQPTAAWNRVRASPATSPGLRSGADQWLQFDHVRQPLPIGQRRRELVHRPGLVVKNACLQIDRDHPPAADVQPALDPVIGDAGHPDLGAADQQPVDRLGHPERSQAVAVLARDHPAAIGGADRGRSVPRLHHRVAVGVERAMVVGDHALDRRLGHQQGLDHGRRATGADQHLEDIVQRRRVRAAGLDHRFDDAVVGPEGLGGHADLVAAHPARIAAQGVDLAVVGQHPERLRQPPLGEGVGRIALVEQGHIGLDPRVVQVRIEVGQRLGEHHPLVDDRPRRQGADVEMLQARGRRPRLDPAAQQVQRPLQFLAVQPVRRAEHDLFDLGPRRRGPLAQHQRMGRHLPPAIEPEPRRHHLPLDDRPRPLLRGQVDAGQEDHADGDRAGPRLVPGVTHLGLEEGPAAGRSGFPPRRPTCRRRRQRPGARWPSAP